MNSQIEELKSFINNSNYTIVITGVEHWHLPTVLQMSSEIILKTMPKRYYKAAWNSFLEPIFNNGATVTHRKLAELENEGKIQGIITTNIDHLHSIAGSKNVAEIQGSFAVNKCLKCGKQYNDINIWNKGKTPRCESNICSCRTIKNRGRKSKKMGRTCRTDYHNWSKWFILLVLWESYK